ncbi:hypothetical protein ACO3_590167 [Thiomonas arsenitoxydans]|nr:hypothetical protein ACO3_590167 [Thiomonas arsenitoxydans]
MGTQSRSAVGVGGDTGAGARQGLSRVAAPCCCTELPRLSPATLLALCRRSRPALAARSCASVTQIDARDDRRQQENVTRAPLHHGRPPKKTFLAERDHWECKKKPAKSRFFQ